MQNLFYYYLPAFYILLYLTSVVISCVVIKTQASFFSAVYLTAFVFAAANDALWGNALSMAAYEMILLLTMFFVFEGKFGTRFMLITCLMIAVNVVCETLGAYESIRQSLINILFFSICIITLRASYNTRQLRKNPAGESHDSFYAFEKATLQSSKMVH